MGVVYFNRIAKWAALGYNMGKKEAAHEEDNKCGCRGYRIYG